MSCNARLPAGSDIRSNSATWRRYNWRMVKVLRATPVELATAVQALRDGELVAFPTETVYGLGANAQNPAAVRRIFEAKGRPPNHPVIVHLDSPRFLHRWVREVPEAATRLAERFRPGPLN